MHLIASCYYVKSLLEEDKQFQFIMVFFPIWHKWAQDQTGSQQKAFHLHTPSAWHIQPILISFLYTHQWIHSNQYSTVKVFNDTSFFTLLDASAAHATVNIPLHLVCSLSLCAIAYAELLFPKAKFWALSPYSKCHKKKQKDYYHNSHENPNK